jgi:hypothetical protein
LSFAKLSCPKDQTRSCMKPRISSSVDGTFPWMKSFHIIVSEGTGDLDPVRRSASGHPLRRGIFFGEICCTRSTPSYKLISEYNLLLTQRLTSYPLVLVGLSCGISSFAKVTDELPTSRTVVALRCGHLALLVGRLSSVAHLSLPTQLLESKPAAYIDNLAALPL